MRRSTLNIAEAVLKRFLLLGIVAPVVLLFLGYYGLIYGSKIYDRLQFLPHIPPRTVAYSIADKGLISYEEIPNYRTDFLGLQITNTGIVRNQGESEAASPYRRPKRQTWSECSIQDYRWNLYLWYHLVKANAQGETIGNTEIATNMSSCTHPRFSRFRPVPLLWRPDKNSPEDLNTLIDASTGLYLEHVFDINDRGQMLCVGRYTDERGAERRPTNGKYHLLLLTPLRKSP